MNGKASSPSWAFSHRILLSILIFLWYLLKKMGSYLPSFIHFFKIKKPFQNGSEQVSHGYFGETGHFCLYKKADKDSGSLSFSKIQPSIKYVGTKA